MNRRRGYFDHNATTPMSAVARAAWLDASEGHWHNPSGLYREGAEARHFLEDRRAALADHFGIDDPARVVFTSGATEANNAVIRHLAGSLSGFLVVSEIEHPSVAAAVNLAARSEQIRTLPTDPATGAVDLDPLRQWIGEGRVGAVSLMAANNETGAHQPWREAAALCREAGLAFHSDAAQWIGKEAIRGLGDAGFVTGSAHKFGGGKGCGFLILPDDAKGESFHGLVGGPQENGHRAGTEDLPGVAAMVAALLDLDEGDLSVVAECQGARRTAFERRVSGEVGAVVLAAEGSRLWNTSMLVLPHGKNLKWLTRLSRRGFGVSTGSACSAGKGNPSAVMMAMGLGFEEMGRVLRISGGRDTTPKEWDGLADAFGEVSRELEGES